MHILSGSFKGRPLKSPKGDATRPTLAKVRGAVFDMFGPLIHEMTMLDLFAGSGAMGFEALSRGASHITFIEKHPLATRAILQNIEALNVKDTTTLLRADCTSALKRLEKHSFDFIYVDPPYELDISLLLKPLAQLLNPQGYLFIEQSKRKGPRFGPLKEILEELPPKSFGDTILYRFTQK